MTWRGVVRREIRALAELLALTALALAVPLLSVFGGAPEQFVFRAADERDIVVFALVVAFVPPLLLWVVEVAVGLVSDTARGAVHLAFVAALVAATLVQVLRPLGDGWLLLVAGAVGGLAAAVVYTRAKAARLWLGYVSIAAPLAVALFLFASSTARLLHTTGAIEGVRVRNATPVVVVVFDELPLTSLIDGDGTIDADLYPRFAALSREATWYRNATTVSSSTWHAVPSITTGRLPEEGTAPIAADHPENLFSLLGGAMELDVTESITRLCPSDLCEVTVPSGGGGLRRLLGDAREILRSRLSPSGAQVNPVAALVEAPADAGDVVVRGEPDFDDFGRNQPERFSTLLDGIRSADDAPVLHYLHVLLPHVPYRYLPSGARYPESDPDLGREGDNWRDEPALTLLARQRNVLQLMYVDSLVGELVDTMRASGVYDDALLVVMADHGISFRPGAPIRALSDQQIDDRNAAELMWAPLFVKLPDQVDGGNDDANVLTIDVLPTIAEVLGVDVPWDVDGHSLLDEPRRDGEKVLYQSHATLAYGVTVGRPYRIDTDDGWQHIRDQAIDSLLPSASDPLRPWRVGPEPHLVGEPARALASRDPITADLEDGDRYEVAASDATVPALLRGTTADVDAGAPIAIVVDGTVVATGTTYADGDDGRVAFAVMLAPPALEPGAHEIEIYAL